MFTFNEKMIPQEIIAYSLGVIILFVVALLICAKKRRRKIQENEQGLQEIFGKNENEDL